MRTVLILEDDAFVARGLANTMREGGWQVLMATSAQQAFTMGRLFAIDLIIADVVLQNGNGVDAVQRITAVRPRVDVLFISEYSRWRLERLLPAGGRYGFLQTPFSNAALLDAVAMLVPEEVVLAETA